jgi:hypothetical protein
MNRITREDLPELRELHRERMEKFQRGLVEREMTRPLPDPLIKWKADAEKAERDRAAARAEIARRPPPPSPDFEVIDARIRAAAAAERRHVLDVTAAAVGEFCGAELRQVSGEIRELRSALAKLRSEVAMLSRALDAARSAARDETAAFRAALETTRATNAVLKQRVELLQCDLDRVLQWRRDSKNDERFDQVMDRLARMKVN